MFFDQNRPIGYSLLNHYIFWNVHGRSHHCMAVGAIWNLSKFTGSTGKCLYSIFPGSRSVLGAKFSNAYNTSTGASKYIKILENHYPANFQYFPKLCITFSCAGLQLSLLRGARSDMSGVQEPIIIIIINHNCTTNGK